MRCRPNVLLSACRRRAALRFGILLCVILGGFGLIAPSRVVSAAADETTPVLTHGPLVGAVTDTFAKVWLRTDSAANVRVRYSTAADLTDALDSSTVATASLYDFTAQVPLSGLTASTVYYYDILVNDAAQLAAPYPHFKSFPKPNQNVAFKFAILTDFGAFDSSQMPVPDPVGTFDAVDAEQPDLVIIGGDFGHKNLDTLADKRQQFKDLYSLNSPLAPMDAFVTKILRGYPLAHMWDDHDIGRNNTNKTYPFKQRSLRVLNEFFPTYPMTAYGDWQSFRYGRSEFFLLDSRSQRDPNPETDNADKSMLDGNNLGRTGQLDWLKRGLLNSKAKWKFIVSPVVFNPTHKKQDAWYGFRYERAALVNYIKSNQITGVIVLSGDSHMGAIDDGTNSGFPEMLVPGPNLALCATVGKAGTWTQGGYWFPNHATPCNGYGVVSVLTGPNRVQMAVKDTNGVQKLFLEVKP